MKVTQRTKCKLLFCVNPVCSPCKLGLCVVAFMYIVVANGILSKNFSTAATLSVRSSVLLCCKIFMLKYFRRPSTLQKFFKRKIFPTKILYNESFLIYGSIHATILYVTLPITWISNTHYPHIFV